MFSLQYPQGLEWQKVHFSPNEHLIRVAHALPPFGRHAVSQQSHGGRGSCHCISSSCSVKHSLTWQEPCRRDSAAFPHPGSALPWPRPSGRQAGQQLCLQLLPTLPVLFPQQELSQRCFLWPWPWRVSITPPRNQNSLAVRLWLPDLLGTHPPHTAGSLLHQWKEIMGEKLCWSGYFELFTFKAEHGLMNRKLIKWSLYVLPIWKELCQCSRAML